MPWEIHPNLGLGPLRFGMTQAEVALHHALLGEVVDTLPAYDGTLVEHRALAMPVCSYKDGRLTSIDTDWRLPQLLFGGLDVYGSDSEDVIRCLSHVNGGAHHGLGFLVFFNLGINTSNFYDAKTGQFTSKDNDEFRRGLTVFAPHAFDALRSEFTPFDLAA